MNILNPCEVETKFQKELRDAAIKKMHEEYAHVNHKEFDYGTLAQKLDLFPSGVKNLMEKDPWTLEVGIRVCKALDLSVILIVEDPLYKK